MKIRRGAEAVIVAMLCATALTACTDSAGREARTGAQERIDWATGPEALASSAYDVVHTLRSGSRGRLRQVIGAVGTDGSLVVSEVGARIESRVEDRHWIVTGAKQVEVRTPPHTRKQQWIGADLSADWLVWKETTSFDLGPEPWTLYAFDRHRQRVRRLTASPKVAGVDPPSVPGHTAPVVAGDRVYWAQAGGGRDRVRSDVYGCLIARCRPRLMMTDAAFPSVGVDGDLYVVHLPGLTATTSPRRMSVTRVDPTSGGATTVWTVPLTGEMPTGFDTDGRVAAWSLKGKTQDRLFVRRLGDGRTTTLASGGQDVGFDSPQVGDDVVAWRETMGTGFSRFGAFVLDLRSGVVRGLGDGSNNNVEAKGPYLSWVVQDGRSPVSLVVRMR